MKNEQNWNPSIGFEINECSFHNYKNLKTAWRNQHNPKMSDTYTGVVEKEYTGMLKWSGKINLHYPSFSKPLKQKKGVTYFVNSMSDLFQESVSLSFVKEVYEVMAKCPRHTFQVLTNRPDIAELFYEQNPQFAYIKQIQIGVIIPDQKTAYERIPTLIRIPAEIRFLSCEPLLGPLNISPWLKSEGICRECGGDGTVFVDFFQKNVPCPLCNGQDSRMQGLSPISLVITGGESGAQARPAHPQWFRNLRDQSEKYGVDYFFKQNGEYFTKNIVNGLPVFKIYHSYNHFLQNPKIDKGDKAVSIDGTQCKTGVDFAKASYPIYVLSKVGKKKAGNLLDGIEYKNLPVVLP